MVKVLKIGNVTKREKMYFKSTCRFCGSELVFEYGDIWWDDPNACTGRIDCPVCRTKVFLNSMTEGLPEITKMFRSTRDEWEGAHQDTSKTGLQILMEEKKKEDISNENINR